MTDDLTSLRRQVLKAGLTGSIVATTGCNTNVETDSPDSDEQSEGGGEENTDQGDGESQSAEIASAELSFEYSSADRQVIIEFAGGADIKAENVQIQQGSETQVSWNELGSTTAASDQNISPGATAVLGENILNWGQPVAKDDLIRVVYTGRDSPATLERYFPPESTDSESTVPASISGFTLKSSGEQQLQISFDSTKQLGTIEIEISGAESATLVRTEFTETASGDGTFIYSASYEASSDGSYTATVAQAADTDGTNALNGENISDTASINTQEQTSDTTPPSISAFSIANPSEQQLRVSLESNEELALIQVSVTGPESTTLSESDFSETEPSSETYTYEATYQASSDGEFTATLEQAADGSENDGSNGQSASVSVQTVDETVIDDFETGSLDSAWVASTHNDNAPSEPRNTFQVQSDIVGEGDYALRGNSGQSSGGTSELTRNDFTIDSDGANLSMYVRLGPILTGYEQGNHIEIYGSTETDETVRILRLGQKDDGRDENDGQVITGEASSISYVEFRNIQFSSGTVSEVRVDDVTVEENVSFSSDVNNITQIQIDQGHFRNQTNIILDEISFTTD